MLDFDSWQRCETVKHLLNWTLPDPGRVLDVGGYPGRMRTMAPDHDWVICDPLVDAPGEQLRGSAIHLPIRDQSFDMSVSLDVLEHIAPDDRANVLQEMIRVSRTGLILTFPFKDPLVEAAEKQVCDAYTHLHHKDHPWLAEHALYPLPDTEEITQQLQSFGGHVAVFDLGDISRWVRLQLLDVLLEALPKSLDLATQLNQIYQDELYIHDFKAPAYRKVLLHLFHADEPISLSMIESPVDERIESDIVFQKIVTQGLLDLVQQNQPVAPPAKQTEALVKDNQDVEEMIEAPDSKTIEDVTKDKTEELVEDDAVDVSPAKPQLTAEVEDYISRLELGVKNWEDTYAFALHNITEAQQWRNDLEQRRSYRIYKLIMRLLGSRIKP